MPNDATTDAKVRQAYTDLATQITILHEAYRDLGAQITEVTDRFHEALALQRVLLAGKEGDHG